MYSWNAVRTFCAVLLLLPIVHLAYLVSQDMLASMENSPEAWAEEVAAYEAADQSTQLPLQPIVILGGRQVKLWHGLEDLLSPRPVLMRGLGDATIEDITHYHAELVSHYQPSALVLLPGPSEFHIRDSKSAEELVTAISNLVELDESYAVARAYLVFAPIKTPLYPKDYEKIDRVTNLLRQWAQERPQVSILDPNALLSRANGTPNPDFFRIDGVNLNEHGYLRLSVLLQNSLQQEQPEAYAARTAAR
jgi:hypothetical protein